MKRYIIILFTLFFASLILGLSSCKPKDKLETPFSRILGRWKKQKYATDDNSNGVIDQSEIFLVESGVNNQLWFRQDSTGIETTNSSPALSFKWSIISGSSVLMSYNANDTVIYTITEISSSDLTLTTTTTLGLAWYYYYKQ